MNGDQRKLYRAALAERAEPLQAKRARRLKSAEGEGALSSRDGPMRAAVVRARQLRSKRRRARSSASRPSRSWTPADVDARAVEGERGKRSRQPSRAASLAPTVRREVPGRGAVGAPAAAISISGGARSRGAWHRGRAASAPLPRPGVAPSHTRRGPAAALAARAGRGGRARKRVARRSALGDPPSPACWWRHRAGPREPGGGAGGGQARACPGADDAGALCAMARAQLAQGHLGVARIFAARAAQADASDPDPLLVKAAIARTSGTCRGDRGPARGGEVDGTRLVPARSRPRSLRAGAAGSSAGRDRGGRRARSIVLWSIAGVRAGARRREPGEAAEQALARAIALSPRAAEPHFELARLKLDGDGDAQAALAEQTFLNLSTSRRLRDTRSMPGAALREALKQRGQASVVQTR